MTGLTFLLVGLLVHGCLLIKITESIKNLLEEINEKLKELK